MLARLFPRVRQQGNDRLIFVVHLIFAGNGLRHPFIFGIRAAEDQVFDVQHTEPTVFPS